MAEDMKMGGVEEIVEMGSGLVKRAEPAAHSYGEGDFCKSIIIIVTEQYRCQTLLKNAGMAKNCSQVSKVHVCECQHAN